jgi:hypothetical protein
MVNIDMLNKGKAAFEPFEGNVPIYLCIRPEFTPFFIPGPDQLIQKLKSRVGFRECPARKLNSGDVERFCIISSSSLSSI